MPTIIDFTLGRSEKGTLVATTNPPTPIGGWSLAFQMTKRQGGTTAIISKSMASGYYGVSGMSVVDSGAGTYNVQFFPAEVSGKDPGAYAYNVSRTDSGYQTTLVFGSRLMDW